MKIFKISFRGEDSILVEANSYEDAYRKFLLRSDNPKQESLRIVDTTYEREADGLRIFVPPHDSDEVRKKGSNVLESPKVDIKSQQQESKTNIPKILDVSKRTHSDLLGGRMKNFKILSHPFLGIKVVQDGGWSWWGFSFFCWYFLFKGRARDFFISFICLIIISIISVLGSIFSYELSELVWYLPMPLSYFFEFILRFLPFFYFLANITLWVHGGLLGNKSRYEKLIRHGFELVSEHPARNPSHALALHGKSKI